MYIADDHTLLEFANIGTIKNNIEISIYTKDGKIPHLHFYCVQDKRKGCIRLDTAQYFSHGSKCDRLNRKELKEFIIAQPENPLPLGGGMNGVRSQY